MLVYLIAIAIMGLITGGLARLALPGPDPLSLLQTMGIGIAGSLIGGILYYAATGGEARGGGYLVGFTCTVLIVYIIRRRRGGDLTHPGRDPRRERP
jgi:uncharacterized membrane protein YeaQ/YmgE (transglycosylase-associated protein family)